MFVTICINNLLQMYEILNVAYRTYNAIYNNIRYIDFSVGCSFIVAIYGLFGGGSVNKDI